MIIVSADLNTVVMKVARRAENAPPEVLKHAFVPVGPLLAHLELPEHQILFGRRGTGKTHLMRFLQEKCSGEGSLAIYVDLRQVGAAEDVFSTRQNNFSQQVTSLLVDVVEHVHSQIYEQVLTERWTAHLGQISGALDALGTAATQIQVVGETEVEEQRESSMFANEGQSIELSVARDPRAAWKAEASTRRSKRSAERRVDRGREAHHVLIGPLSSAIRHLASAISPHELWLFVDEWSALPLDLQPLLADLLRRTFLSTPGVVVKISAIHGRSRFADLEAAGTPIGLELGADTAATLDLDDFLLFRNDAATTLDFYSTLLHRHVTAMTVRPDRVDRPTQRLIHALNSPAKLTAQLFASAGSFHSLVVGAEGVPRDALQIAGLAAGNAYNQPIATVHVATATRDFFLRDKDGRIPKHARQVFNNLMNQAVRQKSRIIPLRHDGESDDEIIQRLYDARVIHRVRQGMSLDSQHPTETYDIYVIDYGCFLGLVRSRRIGAVNNALDPGARFADAGEIEIRRRSFVGMTPRWYRQRSVNAD